MPDSASKPVFLVDAFSDPAVVRIDGRASFQNSGCLRDFFSEMLRCGKTRFVVDFQHCASMDSTFLGVLAGAAIELRKASTPGSLVLARVGQRNLELIRNLGLHRLLIVDSGALQEGLGDCRSALECRDQTELERARMVLEAHENLAGVDDSNRTKFQDVLAFLRNRVGQG